MEIGELFELACRCRKVWELEAVCQIIGIRTAAIAEACDFAVFSFRHKKAVFAGFVP